MSKYLNAFREVQSQAELQLIGDLLLVELIKDEEFKTKSGIVLASAVNQRQIAGLSADKPTFVRVLAAGEGFYDDESDTPASIPLESQPGQILLIATNAIKPFSVFGKLINYGEVEIGLTRESDVQARFEDQEAFDRYFERLNALLAPKSGS